MTPDLSRWPLLTAATVAAGTGVALDLSAHPDLAVGAWTLAAVAVGAFVYAEGARHRDWSDASDTRTPADRIPDGTPDEPRHAGQDRDPWT